MGRTSKVVTSGLLILALAAVTVPAGLNLVPALLPQDQAVAAAIPAAQLPPTALSAVSGIASLSSAAPVPDEAKLAAGLDAALKNDGVGQFSAYVTDAVTGKALYSLDGDADRTPASNLKLLTAAAALKSLGAQTRLATSVVSGPTPNTLVLKAGGDAMLAAGDSDPTAVMGHAGLSTLAKETAAALTAAGAKGPVTLSLDDSLFTGPALNPNWDFGDVEVGEIAPIYPIALYAGRFSAGVMTAPRPQDAAMTAAETFATALAEAGVATTGEISRAAAPAGKVLASVDSATVAQQVQYLLAESDNYEAEVMARLVAVAQKQEASNAGAMAAVRQVVQGLGVSLDGVVTVDNCGLGHGNLVSAHTLVEVIAMMLKNPGADVGQALEGLPIAGLTGTLGARFTGPATVDAAGLVRAKTGTLNVVSALTGYVINAQGRLLAFSIIGNKLDGGPASAIPVIDAAAAVLAKS
ncbi:MAG: D-alanyl-D-alanine carboxypeptidase/D-alanyl-D-alanine-endopeptidase [Specibacter sp.]